jgi:L-ascorbate metabolism protein UlaG (beta-lactamase superfamily)
MEPTSTNDNAILPNIIATKSIKENKKVFIFSSHSHGDHFNPDILAWEKINTDVTYILSNDITIDVKKPNYIFMKEDDETIFNDFYIKAYGSTDIGISFLVKFDGLTIFHAGDLNWWHWKEDSLEERNLAETNFKIQIAKLKNENAIDIAFFPVDPRLEEYYYLGGQYFCEHLKPKMLIPMHFDEDLWVTNKFSEKMDKINISPVVIYKTHQEIDYIL